MADRQRLSEMTLGDLFKATERYRPVIVVVVAVFLVVTFLPGKPTRTSSVSTSASGTNGSPLVNSGDYGAGGTAANGAATGDTGSGALGAGSTGVAAGGTVGSGGSTGGSGTGGSVNSTGTRIGSTNTGQMGPDCDPATGRIRFPSVYAMPCVPPFQGDNGGATYKTGVTKDTITIASYRGQPDPASQAILAAAGDTDTEDQIRQQILDDVELFSRHTELYGRKVKVVFVDGSGKADDQDAAKADAIKVATQVKAFMSWGSPNNAYLNELTARGILCVCTTTLPRDFYLAHAPYVWGNGLPDENQAYLMRAEMICKQIQGRKAKWAGDALLQQKDRSFGLIYYETADKAYAAGEKFFEEQLQSQCGLKLADKAAYIFDTTTAQQDSKTIISKFASENITSVIFVGDPIYPVFYTQAATNQNYHPEWIITGSALTDTTLFARTYDQSQWSHGFGLSLLSARAPKQVGEAWRIYNWQFNRDPVAPGSQGVIWPTVFLTFVGLEGAGPKVTPQTFRDGMFKYPVSPKGPHITNGLVSWGRQLWSWDDYNLYDDACEIWWDNTTTGPDEYGNNGVGVYRYVSGGKRFLPGGVPTGDFPAFNPAGTVVVYDSLPPDDKYPDYPHKDFH